MPKITASSSGRSTQDYLRALALLSSNKSSGAVRTTEVSRYLRVAPASATQMFEKLARGGYVAHSPYYGTSLTRKGLRAAQRVTRKHRLLERFLSDVLLIPKERVHAQACDMEHTLSDEAEESMCRLLNHPNRCPDDGQVIPACDLPLSSCERCAGGSERGPRNAARRRKENLIPVCSMKRGATGRVSFIRGERTLLQKLQRIGLTAGTQIGIVSSSLDGRVTLSTLDSTVSLDPATSPSIFVRATPKGTG